MKDEYDFSKSKKNPYKLAFNFEYVTEVSHPLVLKWLEKSHIAKWFHGDGLKSTIDGLDTFVKKTKKDNRCYWLVCDGDIPFGLLITSVVDEAEETEHLKKWLQADKKMITLDMFIGEESYLGKGFATKIIKDFINTKFNDIDIVFIDPESTNTRAIHVYEKAGFEKIDSFIAPWHKVPHTLMWLQRYN